MVFKMQNLYIILIILGKYIIIALHWHSPCQK